MKEILIEKYLALVKDAKLCDKYKESDLEALIKSSEQLTFLGSQAAYDGIRQFYNKKRDLLISDRIFLEGLMREMNIEIPDHYNSN